MDWDVIVQWTQVLDTLSYYDLFRVAPSASSDELRQAFYAFAENFHPDAHSGRPRHEREALGEIFKRGNEAYRVLSNTELRVRYDEALTAGNLRPSELLVVGGPSDRSPSLTPRGPDRKRNPGARPFVVRAEELLRKGDPKQAKIQLTMALHMDKGNPALDDFLKEIETAIKSRAEDDKKKWQKGP